jgi:hypothetical protein
MSVDTAAKPSRMEPASLGFNLATIVVVLALGGVALAYAIDAAGRDPPRPVHRADSGTELTRTLGGKELTIPVPLSRTERRRLCQADRSQPRAAAGT